MSLQPDNSPTLLAIHPLAHQGRRLLGVRWVDFLRTLQEQLQKSGLEEQDSTADLLLFSFSHPFAAFAALAEILEAFKKESHWKASQGGLPIQIVLDLEDSEENSTHPLRVTTSPVWDFLRSETLYISRSLKRRWEQLLHAKNMPPHTLHREEMGLYRVRFKERTAIKSERLFPSREIPALGRLRECFYCGMTTHVPAVCPSKQLAPETEGLSLVGYLPFTRLNALYKESFSRQQELTELLSTDLKPSRIRQDPLLQVFLSYFDLFHVYQPRFLHQIAFSMSTSWEGLRNPYGIKIENRNLFLGLDCLRVGQYAQAEQLFAEEGLRHQGNQFCAMVGQAFRALEMDRQSDLFSFLQKAHSLADEDKEKIYIGLLLARYHDLQQDRWKAEHAIDSVLAMQRTNPDAQYCKIQIQVRNGFGEQAYKQLRSLIKEEKELFMTALMDPLLLPVQGLVEDLLAAHLQTLTQQASGKLANTRKEVEELSSWFEAEEADFQEISKNLHELEEQFTRRSYYDLLEVANRAERLTFECHHQREKKIDALKARLEVVKDRLNGCQQFWDHFPYQPVFKAYLEGLSKARDKKAEAAACAEQVRGDSHRAAWHLLDEVTAELDLLRNLFQKMVWVRTLLDGLRIFGKKLVITELLLILFGGLLLLGIGTLPGEHAGTALRLLQTPWLLRQGLVLVTVFLAPLIALAMTVWRISES